MIAAQIHRLLARLSLSRDGLIGKLCIELSPKNVLEENDGVTAVNSVLETPRRIVPDQRFSSDVKARSLVQNAKRAHFNRRKHRSLCSRSSVYEEVLCTFLKGGDRSDITDQMPANVGRRDCTSGSDRWPGSLRRCVRQKSAQINPRTNGSG
jgi:hypothetical protein